MMISVIKAGSAPFATAATGLHALDNPWQESYGPAVASVLPNIYDEATLRDFAAFDSGRALSEAEYERVQALHSRDVRPLAAI